MNESITAISSLQRNRRTERILLLAQLRFCPESFVVLRPPRDRPSLVIACKTVFTYLIRNGQRMKRMIAVLKGIPECETVIKSPKDNTHLYARMMMQMNRHLVMFVANNAFLTPNCFPLVIIRAELRFLLPEFRI